MKHLLILGIFLFSVGSFGSPIKTQVGYIEYNGRCPNFGIAFHHIPNEEAPSGTCVVIPSLETLDLPLDSKSEAIRALIGKKIQIRSELESTSNVLSVLSVKLVD